MLCGACGPSAGPGEPVGVSRPLPTAGREAPAPAPDAVELALRRADGTFLDVGDLRGQVVLLFLFATFDAMSQVALHPLRAVAEANPRVRIVGIAAQPSARLLIDAYVHALSPPFEVTYDPEDRVQEGTSALGAIAAVPTVIVLDRRGRIAARHTGFADEARLRTLLAAGGAR